MTETKYVLVVYPVKPEDGTGFIAIAPDLYGCTGDGETPEAAVADVILAIGEWIAEAKRLGRTVPAPGAHIERERRKDKAVRSVIKAQERVIKEQDKLLTEAQAELKNLKDALSEYDADNNGEMNTWLADETALPAALAAKAKAGNRSPKLN